MRKNTLLLWCLTIVIGVSNAQVVTPFKERFSRSLEGGVTIIANNIISNNKSDDYTGDGDNGGRTNGVFVDIDNDGTTFNSSSANFKNPEVSEPCISVLRAFLYWTGANSQAVSDWDFNEVKLMLPGDTNYTKVVADDVIYQDTGTFSNKPYVCVKDISQDVLRLGTNIYGKYQVANVEAETALSQGNNAGAAAGWQIVFIYESPELTAKNITLFDGYAHINGASAGVDIDFTGFVTVPSGPVGGDIVFGSLEGDRGIFGDQLLIKNISGDFVDLIAPQRETFNFFNSRITVGEGDFLDRNPASTNTLGFDAGVFKLDNPGNTILNNNSTATTLRITSNREVYGIYLLGLAVEVYKPNLEPMLITQINRTSAPIPGDSIEFNFELQNRGNDDTLNLTLSSILPPQINYVTPKSGTLPAGVSFTYDEDTNKLNFNIDDGLMDIGDPKLSINMEFQIKDECYFLQENCELEFELEFEASFNGATNPDDPLISLSTMDPSTCVDEAFIITIAQPDVVAWETQPTVLNRTLDCGDADGLTKALALFPALNKCAFTLNKTTGDLVPDPNCLSLGTYTNTWNLTDACGVTIADYIQVIKIEDNEAPTATNPSTINVQCMADVPDPDPEVVTDAADNCSTPVVELASEDIEEKNCQTVITRVYRVTDACGKFKDVTQVINVKDDIAPELITPLDDEDSICGEITEVPLLKFSDNCIAKVIVSFSEKTNPIDSMTKKIIRTWVASDECGNENTYTQEITVKDSSFSDVKETNSCIEDEAIDLNSLITNTTNFKGTWRTSNPELLDGSIFNPANSRVGNYEFRYTYLDGDCSYETLVNVEINDDCLKCEKTIADDISISKLFTPNNDGRNDFLEVNYDVKNSSARLCTFTISIEVYNRWGKIVYTNSNYDNTWSGDSPTGSVGGSGKLPTGTYYYIVKFNDTAEKIKPIQGFVLLGSK